MVRLLCDRPLVKVDPAQILWTPAGENLPSLSARALVDVTDGDTPNIRMPVRMLSIDTPEVTAGSPSGARRVDFKFAELVQWMKDRIAAVSAGHRDYDSSHSLPAYEYRL